MAKKNGSAGSHTASAPTNGGLVFEVMGDDFEVPSIIKGTSQFQPLMEKLKALPAGKVAVAFKCPYDKARSAYTKGKALQKYAIRAGTPVETAVRKNIQTEEAWLYVQLASPATEEAETPKASKRG